MTGGTFACLGTALLLGVTAEQLVPHIAARWIPRPPGEWPWPARLSVASVTAATAGLLIWKYRPHQPAGYLLLAAWLTLAFAGVLLCAVDITAHRLPTPIIAATGGIIGILLTVEATLTRRPSFVVVPALAAMALGSGYLLLAAAGASSAGMGDVRLAALTGLVLGTSGWHTVLYGALLPYLLAVPFALAARRRLSSGDPSHLPFGPFLICGAILAVST